MAQIPTQFAGYACAFSPFHEDLLAAATAQYFGIVGNGKLCAFRRRDAQSRIDATNLLPGGTATAPLVGSEVGQPGVKPGVQMRSTEWYPAAEWTTLDAVYDCCWSEANERVLAAAQGDGTVALFDMANRERPIGSSRRGAAQQRRVASGAGGAGGGGAGGAGSKEHEQAQPEAWDARFPGHTQEVYSVKWHGSRQSLFASASCDGSIILWDAAAGGDCRMVRKIAGCHGDTGKQHPIYETVFAPSRSQSNLMASCGGDGRLCIYDLNAPVHAPAPGSSAAGGSGIKARPQLCIQAHQYETLCLDWSKYQENVLCTGSVDKTLRVWDLRMVREAGAAGATQPQAGGQPGQQQPLPPGASRPMQTLYGHQLAIRRLRTHPFQGHIVATSSYDMSVKTWDIRIGQLCQSFDHHKEFVCGLDWSLFQPEGMLASASWDRSVCVWSCGGPAPMVANPMSTAPRGLGGVAPGGAIIGGGTTAPTGPGGR